MSDFDWSNDDSIVHRSYGSIAVYTNDHGCAVIRQEGDSCEEDDVVIIPVEQLGAVITALKVLQNEFGGTANEP